MRVTGASATLSGLQPGRVYTATVAAVNATGTGAGAAVAWATPPEVQWGGAAGQTVPQVTGALLTWQFALPTGWRWSQAWDTPNPTPQFTTSAGWLAVAGLSVGSHAVVLRFFAPGGATVDVQSPAVAVQAVPGVSRLASGAWVVASSVAPATRLLVLQLFGGVSLPGLTSGQVAYLQLLTRRFAAAVTGVLANGVLIVNPRSPAAPLLLATVPLAGGFPGVSIPGLSGAQVAEAIALAHAGRLTSLTAANSTTASGGSTLAVTGASVT